MNPRVAPSPPVGGLCDTQTALAEAPGNLTMLACPPIGGSTHWRIEYPTPENQIKRQKKLIMPVILKLGI